MIGEAVGALAQNEMVEERDPEQLTGFAESLGLASPLRRDDYGRR